MKIGVLGNGQLARMLALAGKPLGLDFAFCSADADGCANTLGDTVHCKPGDSGCIRAFADGVDVVTFENENVSPDVLKAIPADRTLPPARSILTAQDRLTEKRYLEKLGIAVPGYFVIDSEQDLLHALHESQTPLIVKTRRQGYDGRGQARIHTKQEAHTVWQESDGNDLIAEVMVAFEREVSMIAVRGHDDEMRFYPVTENHHEHGILMTATVRPNDPVQNMAEDYTRRLMQALDYVGVLGFEFFDCHGELLANEFAPRVHNTGHWSLDGAVCSQFENHLRAVCGLPLGDTSMLTPSTMFNIIGDYPDLTAVLKLPGVHYHHYQKQPRPNRKTGHITVCGHDDEAMRDTITRVIEVLGWR